MRAEVNLLWAQFAELCEQLFPILHVGVVRFVRAEEPPDRFQLALRLRGVHADRDGKRIGCLHRRDHRGSQSCDGRKHEIERCNCVWRTHASSRVSTGVLAGR